MSISLWPFHSLTRTDVLSLSCPRTHTILQDAGIGWGNGMTLIFTCTWKQGMLCLLCSGWLARSCNIRQDIYSVFLQCMGCVFHRLSKHISTVHPFFLILSCVQSVLCLFGASCSVTAPLWSCGLCPSGCSLLLSSFGFSPWWFHPRLQVLREIQIWSFSHTRWTQGRCVLAPSEKKRYQKRRQSWLGYGCRVGKDLDISHVCWNVMVFVCIWMVSKKCVWLGCRVFIFACHKELQLSLIRTKNITGFESLHWSHRLVTHICWT